MSWIENIELAFDESIQELGVDMDEACDNGTYPKARDNVIDAVAALFSDDYDPRLDKLKDVPFFRVSNAYVNLQFLADYMHTRMTERGDKLDKAEAENKELRELMAELYNCSRQCGCDTCGYKDDCTILGRMAELGVKEDQ